MAYPMLVVEVLQIRWIIEWAADSLPDSFADHFIETLERSRTERAVAEHEHRISLLSRISSTPGIVDIPEFPFFGEAPAVLVRYQ